MYSWLQEAIADNAVVVTASRRLARELRLAFDQQQLASGRKSWLTPTIQSWRDWLNRQSSGVYDPNTVPKRLNGFSSTLMMERSLRKFLPDGTPGVAGIVRQSIHSWQRLRDWQVSLEDLHSSAGSQDERVYALAVADYARALNTQDWVDGAGMADLVANLIAKKAINVPGKMVLAGFDRKSPAVRNILRALEGVGCAITTAGMKERITDPDVMTFPNMESEWRAAGAWARERLHENPGARVAIVSPTLEMNAPMIARLIREGLVPGWQYGRDAYAASVNVSYGRKLAEYPAIAIALLLLRWAHQGLTSREISLLLRSRCIGGSESSGRSRVELKLRKCPDRVWSPEDFLRFFAGSDKSHDSIVFLDCVSAFAMIRKSQHELTSPAEWAKRIDAALMSANWPGDESLDSSEFQLINRWRELLNEFAGIEVVKPRIDLQTACQHLTTLAAETLYQVESGRGFVQVLGTLEAAGLEFDNVWIGGLDSSQWPPSSRPALFISNSLQRELGMPDATPAETLEFARDVLGRLTSSAKNCVLSWATTREGAELTASSLLDAFGGSEQVSAVDPGWYAHELVGRVSLETPDKDGAPPVMADEHVRGGAYTVQRQAVEPFGAFVHGRLGVRLPDPIMVGLSPGVRGNIIHNALHNLLSTKPSQTDIVEWTTESREQRIGSAIDSALAEHVINADQVTSHIIGIERRRLRRLLVTFIEAESVRQRFAVLDVEKRIDYEVFGLRLGLRIDRVDQLTDGKLLVIDYKTGLSKSFLGRNNEPIDLQLVVYADALNADIGGLVLVNVDSRIISYKGAGVEGGPWKVRDPQDWKIALGSWVSRVRSAMREIAEGDVRINLLHSENEGRPLNLLSRKEEQKRVYRR